MIACYHLTRIVKKQLQSSEADWVRNEKPALHPWKNTNKNNKYKFLTERVNTATTTLRFVSLIWVALYWRTELSRFERRAAAFSCWELTGMVKSINELYCILSSPTSLGMHVCMLNIWICIGIEHLLSELAVSQRCALNNNPADKWAAFSLPSPCNRKW